jgi:uncharacterized protein YkwD
MKLRAAGAAAPMLVVCTVMAVLCALPEAARSATPAEAVRQEINDFRADHGLPGLRASPSLDRSSVRFARSMMARDQFGHADQINASQIFSRLGELLQFRYGWQTRPRLAVRSWKHSPSHTRLLLSRSFDYAGGGRSKGYFGQARATIWVVQLGSR